jgi:prephenate dehydrogenase
MPAEDLTVIGVGLIGGSVALAAKKRGLAGRIYGIDKDPHALSRAIQRGVIDQRFDSSESGQALGGSIVICTPVDQIVKSATAVMPRCRPGAVLTDTGSVKTTIVSEIDKELSPGIAFVGGHPLAGSEKQGVEFADADLFAERLVVLTPGPHTSRIAVERVADIWQRLGARVTCVSPRQHDEALARTSHVPHLVSSALASGLTKEREWAAASGFRSMTRLAAGAPSLWAPILMENRQAVSAGIQELRVQLDRIERALQAADAEALAELLAQAKRQRDDLGN